MHYGEIKNCDIANGPGVRVSLFVSGCTHRCPGCFNEIAWDFNYGTPFTQDTIDEILDMPYNKEKVYVTLESKVFGIGLESYTVGSAEFTLGYASANKLVPLMDNGHYHPTEVVSDKISSILAFDKHMALHVTRGVRWDSDHVVLFDDETKEIAKEIVRNNALDRVFIATDYFDASINRISAWVTGVRSVQKALLFALLQPDETLALLDS